MEKQTDVKIIIVGESSVGKTALLFRYSDNKYTADQISTVGVDFRHKDVIIEGQKVRLKLWDTAGQEKYRAIARSYFKAAHGAFVVFAVNNQDSFDQVQYWIDGLKEKEPLINIILLGNKTDLPRTVKREDAEKIAKENNIRYFEVSAKSGDNINEAFECLATEVYKRLNSTTATAETTDKSTVVLDNKNPSDPQPDKKQCNC